MKKDGKIVMCGFQKELDKKVEAPGEFKKLVIFHKNISFLALILTYNTFVCVLTFFCIIVCEGTHMELGRTSKTRNRRL